MEKNHSKKYSSNIVVGSLLVRESEIIARLFLENMDDRAWHRAIVIDNVLQKRSPETAKRMARLIKKRLTLMKPEFYQLIVHGTSDISVQALLAASIKHSRLLGDFMNTVVKSHWRLFDKQLTDKDWKDFIETCAQLEPGIRNWTDATRAKLKQVIFRILAEAKYVSNTKSRELLPVIVAPEIKRYLIRHSENYVLNCMEITP